MLRARLAPIVLALTVAAAAQDRSSAAHWAFRGPERPPVPAVASASHPIDAFVLRLLDARGLTPTPRADDATLVRRLKLDLVGLPPTREDLDWYRAQPADVAWERLVDRFLAHPGHAERQTAIWLDLARYADSAGYGSDPLRTIWRYRDWVIDAFERNLPFDEFTVLQMAGDLLPDATWREQLPTAFHRNTMTNTEGGTDDEEFRVEAVRDRVDTTMLVWMGLTAGCAKCHDHKFDPISQREYYQLADVFNHTADADRGDEQPRVATPTPAQQARFAELEARAASIRQRLAERPDDLPQRRAVFAARHAAAARGWSTAEAVMATAASGAGFERLDDGSLRVTGPAAERDRYRLELRGSDAAIGGVALDLLPEPGSRGVGRAEGNGNVVVSELRVGVAPAADAPPRARFARIELPGAARILSLAEVEVLDTAGENLARGRPARQASTDFDGDAGRAVDGVRDGRYETGSVTHCRQGDDPWWEVDLGVAQSIARVVVWNRVDGDLERRLRGAELVLLDADRDEVWRGEIVDLPAPDTTLDLRRAVRWRRPVRATASFEQRDWPIAAAVDGRVDSTSGWAFGPRFAEPQTGILAFDPPLAVGADERLVVSIEQQYGGHHVAGRVRVRVTSGEVLDALPLDARAALAVEPGARTEAQRAALDEHVLAADPERAALREELAAVERERGALDVVTTPVLAELPADRRRATHVMRRGNFLSRGAQVAAGVPAALHPWPADAPRDRLGFARWLVSRDNPLTARVQVNRVWARLFGRGLVATEEDFGTQGSRPTHPDLLDWLAVEFMDSGWDLRHVWRLIVTSQTYQQDASGTPESWRADPDCVWLSRAPRPRLEAEMIRDQALAFAGLLSDVRYGPSVFPPQPDGLWRAAFNGADRRWRTSTGADRYRRAIYTFHRRSSPYPAMATFDAPTREICTLRRIPTNTPLQAFVTLNDPAFVECAQAFARRIVAEGGAEVGSRARFALTTCLLRDDLDRELEVIAELWHREHARFVAEPGAALELVAAPTLGPPPDVEPADLAAWTLVANVLLNLDAVVTRP